jgi:hypothetical protein
MPQHAAATPGEPGRRPTDLAAGLRDEAPAVGVPAVPITTPGARVGRMNHNKT